VLDLGFFASIQSLQWTQEPANSIEGLIANVERVWNEYNAGKLNREWLLTRPYSTRSWLAMGETLHIGKEGLETTTSCQQQSRYLVMLKKQWKR
jgi:hypothetical protein